MWTLLQNYLGQVFDKPRQPLVKLDTPPGITPWGEYDHEQPVYRSPCGVAQCLALNHADAARIEYGTYKQLHQMIGSMQWTSGRGYSTIAVAIRKTALLLRLRATQVNLGMVLVLAKFAQLPQAGMWGIVAQVLSIGETTT
jgi:hypothetical protein